MTEDTTSPQGGASLAADRPTAVVTGASRGIGRAIASRLAREYRVVAIARSRPALERLAAEIKAAGGACTPLALDLTDPAAIERNLLGIDAAVVVNNAGVITKRPLLELTGDEWRKMVDVNLNAVFYVTRALLGGMVERRRGHVVIIGSIAGRSAFAGGTGYTATKHAVMGFSESLLLEVRDKNVKVSVVMPGSVTTDAAEVSSSSAGVLRPSDVADAVAHVLATPPAALIHRLEIRVLTPRPAS